MRTSISYFIRLGESERASVHTYLIQNSFYSNPYSAQYQIISTVDRVLSREKFIEDIFFMLVNNLIASVRLLSLYLLPLDYKSHVKHNQNCFPLSQRRHY
jgi:hypothetical protein